MWNTSLQLFDLNYKFELVGASLLALAKSIYYCTLANRKVFLRQITAGWKHNSARLDKWLEILAVEGLNRKNGDLNFRESSEEEDQSVNQAACVKPESE